MRYAIQRESNAMRQEGMPMAMATMISESSGILGQAALKGLDGNDDGKKSKSLMARRIRQICIHLIPTAMMKMGREVCFYKTKWGPMPPR